LARFQPEEILRTLERHRVQYVLIGGVAATLRQVLPALRLLLEKIRDRSSGG